MTSRRVIIMGAAGRDFHNFNMLFRNNKKYRVVCFTAAQLPGIEKRRYPGVLAGRLYSKGIPIYPEKELPELIKKHRIDVVVLAYSDLSHEEVMHKASLVLSCGADFWLLGLNTTMLKSKKPVITVCAVRTGCGKSQTTRYIAELLRSMEKRVVVVRHPMPYGDLRKQVVQRFAKLDDLDKNKSTIEEREEYEPHIKNGNAVYAGVDYEKILRKAEKEADVILWDGGNNDLPFFKPDLHIVVTDPFRPDHETKYYPGEANLRMADVVIINKTDTAKKQDVRKVEKNVKRVNPGAKILKTESRITPDKTKLLRQKKRALVIEDGPTLTHGNMSFGAGYLIAKRYGMRVIDPRKYVIGSLKTIYKKYTQLGPVLPAMGYSNTQVKELEKTINRTPCDVVIIATPTNLSRYMKISRPVVFVTYELREKKPTLKNIIKKVLTRN